jgi:PASTA domain
MRRENNMNGRGGGRVIRVSLMVMAVAALAACGSGSNTVDEPNVVGDTQAAATTAITGASLTLGTVTMQSSTTVAAGVVISQSPSASTSVSKGGAVDLVVSSGVPTVAAPAVTGDTQAAATTALTGAGLTLGAVTMASSTTVASGKVISENPAAGAAVNVGSAVNLVVSTGVTFGGVAAAGNAVANNPGYALDAVTGTQIPFTTDANGNYSVDVFGYSGPFLLRVLGVSTGATPVDLYSLAAAATNAGGTTVNVTPLSDLVLGYAAGVTTTNLEAACTANLPACPALLNGILASLTTANSAVVAAIPGSVWSAFGITPATFNAITTQFATTHTGVDGLLDALSIVPPATTGASYTVSLVGATPTPLATLPTSGVAGTEGGVPVASPAPTTAAVTQAANLAAVEPEIQTFFGSVTALFATSQPSAAQVTALLAPGFLNDGENTAAFSSTFPANNPIGFTITGGGVAPYSSAQYTGTLPGPAITYDANNCVTSIWVYVSDSNVTDQLVDTIPTTNAAGTCTGGTWLFAGNGRTYASQLSAAFSQVQTQLSATGTTYIIGVKLSTQSNQTPDNPAATAPYTYVGIGGPGLTTVGLYQGGQADVGYVLLVAATVPAAPVIPNVNNAIWNNTTYQADPYYAGSTILLSCASIVASGSTVYSSGTPCYDSNLVAGSDYGIGFYDAGFNLLASEEQRVNISPATTVVPTSYYPTITGVSPASVAAIATGSTATSVTVTSTAPAGSSDGAVSLNYSVTNLGTISGNTQNVILPATTPLTTTFSISGLSVAPTTGFAGMDDYIGGLHVSTGYQF